MLYAFIIKVSMSLFVILWWLFFLAEVPLSVNLWLELCNPVVPYCAEVKIYVVFWHSIIIEVLGEEFTIAKSLDLFLLPLYVKQIETSHL